MKVLRVISEQLALILKRVIYLLNIESHDDPFIDKNYRCGHVSEPLEIGHRVRIPHNVLFLKLYPFLRKILLRLIAEQSTALGIDGDSLRHFSIPHG